MQISQSTPGPPKAGQLVRVRGARWRIADIRAYDACQLVTLTGVAPPGRGSQRQVLTPFDTIEAVDRRRRPRVVRAAPWRRACRGLIASDTPPGGLRTVRHAGIDVMPHQLEPALAILRGRGSRLLLADEVGLGKTIQAGIVISELHARGYADRVLVLTPAGLREQWAQELATRFALDAHVASAATLRRHSATLPIGVNPWSTERIAIASIDYVKRPEVIPAVAANAWDVIVVDEAHEAAGDSDRRAAVHALASRAACVLLLTATPHSGDRGSFASLCSLGSIDDESLLVFRRARSDIRGGAIRRVHALPIRPNADEVHMHALLGRYTEAIQVERDQAWLAVSVLHKRALSSAWSLAQSVDRRLQMLGRSGGPGSEVGHAQLSLPLADPDGELTGADEPPAWPAGLGLVDAAREARLLTQLLAAARVAARHETKLDAVARILRRANEPAIVFTEYRDTLLRVQQVLGRPAAVLHGGLDRGERAAALDDFLQRRRTVLLATDAAGEGLNLHQNCRLVINLELPWNPMRLEQRIGRVDRIGQSRTVHAFHLIAAGTGETRILTRLKDRIARAKADIGAPNPVGAEEERAIASLVIRGADDGREVCPAAGVVIHSTPDVGAIATAEAHRLARARSLTDPDDHPGDDAARLLVESDGPWILRARRPALRASLGRRVILVWTLGCEDACGKVVESASVPTIVELSRLPCVRDRQWIADVLQRIDGDIQALITASTAEWRDEVDRLTRAFRETRLTRERAIGAALRATPFEEFQPGLFDRRSERSRLAAAVNRQLARRDQASRIERLESGARLVAPPPRLLLILVP